MLLNEMKTCFKCNQVKSFSEFYADRRRTDGLRAFCKPCWKKYGVVSKEKKAEYDRAYYQKVKERRKALKADPSLERKITRRDGPAIDDEYRREYNRRQYELNIEKNRAKARAWQKTERGRVSNRNAGHKRRARMQETDISLDWLLDLKRSSVYCVLCDVELTENDHLLPTHKELDHILPLAVGGSHVMSNVRYTCRRCNEERPKDGSDV